MAVDAELLPDPDDGVRTVTLSAYEWRRVRRALHEASTKGRAKYLRDESSEALDFFIRADVVLFQKLNLSFLTSLCYLLPAGHFHVADHFVFPVAKGMGEYAIIVPE